VLVTVYVLSTDSLLLLRRSWTVIHNIVPSVETEWCQLENFHVVTSFICEMEIICGVCVSFCEFFRGCLRSWLYQDNSCPLCRMSIPVTPTPMHGSRDLATGSGGLSDINIATTRHRVHFQLRNRRNPPGYVNIIEVLCISIGSKANIMH